MTEREFVLNNFYNVYIHIKELELCGEEESIIQALKQTYKTICENTSEECDDVKTARIDEIIKYSKMYNYDVNGKLIEMLEKLKGN